jgi:cysteine desulfurase / selenocysteine lyase
MMSTLNSNATIYLDHAATSWPKRPEVIQAMVDFCQQAGGNPGRSGHRLSLAASRVVYETREAVAELLGMPDPMRVIFTCNATQAINLAIRGWLRPGDRVVTTGSEHNAVMRPLRDLQRVGVQVTVIPCQSDGSVDLQRAAAIITPGTRMVVISHAGNVSGVRMPITEFANLAQQAGALLLVDAAQTAGLLPIDVTRQGIDLLAFTGHKSLQGPMGTGGLVIGAGVDPSQLRPLIQGGTGSRSADEIQPELLPDKFESGTPNGVGIAGLGAGVRWVIKQGVQTLCEHDRLLSQLLVQGLSAIPHVTVHGPFDPNRRVATVSFTVANRHVSEVGGLLDERFGILCRVGLHCAPAAHRTLGTFPQGTVRFAAGPSIQPEQVRRAVTAVEQIVLS